MGLAIGMPATRRRCRVLAIAGHSQDDRILPTLRAGAMGCIVKHDPPEEIRRQLRLLASGAPPLNGVLAGQILRELEYNGLAYQLEDDELELLIWLYAGGTPEQAAAHVGASGEAAMQMFASIWEKIFVAPAAEARLAI